MITYKKYSFNNLFDTNRYKNDHVSGLFTTMLFVLGCPEKVFQLNSKSERFESYCAWLTFSIVTNTDIALILVVLFITSDSCEEPIKWLLSK